MRDLFQTMPDDAAQAALRRAPLRRFYGKTGTAATVDGYAVALDEKPLRTPARRVLLAPSLALAQAIAAEWEAQSGVIDPRQMPLTRLANVIIDGVADAPRPVAADIEKYLASDLVFYRAGGPQELLERQARHWDPILEWVAAALGARFRSAVGIVHIAQAESALAAARAAIPEHAWRLGAAHAATTLTGSALLALALARGRLSAADAWAAANVDEDFNLETWGRDELALERQALRFAELNAAATVLNSLPG
ncbi:MAG TPA: ATP12 family protein [Xanthobacteraceae bacterium]|jgi:chaperone required for assembly of F1-ATPase